MYFEEATTTLLDIANTVTVQANAAAQQASGGGQDLWFSFLGIDWSTPTWDIMILLFLIISVIVYSFTLGRDRIVALLISTYLSLAITTNLPYVDKLTEYINQAVHLTFQVPAFLIVFILIFVFLSRSSLLQGLSSLSGGWWQTILFSLLQVGLLSSVILSFLPEAALLKLSFFTQIVFTSDLGRFCWILLPILGLVFFKGRRSKLDFG
jgi:hypothetical protein